MVGPPLGGALIGIFGPVTTVVADAVSYLLSALGLSAISRHDVRPVRAGSARRRRGEVLEGWRYIRQHPSLRALLANTAVVNGLIMATAPLIAVLMLGRLHIAPWQYGLAFAAPCLGGLIGARLARRLVARHGQHTVLRRAGTWRACWSIGLAFVPGGWAGVGLVALVQLGLVTCCGVFNPVSATYRLEQTPERPPRPDPRRVDDHHQAGGRRAHRVVGCPGRRASGCGSRSRSPASSCSRPRCCFPREAGSAPLPLTSPHPQPYRSALLATTSPTTTEMLSRPPRDRARSTRSSAAARTS